MSEGILASGSENVWEKWLTARFGGGPASGGRVSRRFKSSGGWAAGSLPPSPWPCSWGRSGSAARVAARRWVVDTGSGLRSIGEPAEISVEDRQVTAVRLAYRHKYAAGIRKHTTGDFPKS